MKATKNKNADIEIDHIGIAVSTIGEANKFWSLLGWNQQPEVETVSSEKVHVGMLGVHNNANIELLEASDESSPIAKFIQKRGPGIHHICLRVKNIDDLVTRLVKSGVKMINEKPVPGAGGMRVAFVHPRSTGGVLVELSSSNEG